VRNTAEADVIEDFLTARGGVESFLWTPPTGSQGTYICESWTRQITGPGRFIINATFEQVFEEPFAGEDIDADGFTVTLS